VAISDSEKITHHQLLFPYTTDLDIMADLAGQVMAVAQLVVPLEGMDFLLNVIGFNIVEQCMHIMEVGLADYEDFRYLVEKDI
jgi:hypothetical protein